MTELVETLTYEDWIRISESLKICKSDHCSSKDEEEELKPTIDKVDSIIFAEFGKNRSED